MGDEELPTCPDCGAPMDHWCRILSTGGRERVCQWDICPGHGRPGEPCWGEMRCYNECPAGPEGDEWADSYCLEACEGHHDQAFDVSFRGDKATKTYVPKPA